MPGIKGTQLAEEAAKICPNVPVIFISGYGEDLFDESFGSSRNFHFLPKPYTLQQITEKVKDTLSKK